MAVLRVELPQRRRRARGLELAIQLVLERVREQHDRRARRRRRRPRSPARARRDRPRSACDRSPRSASGTCASETAPRTAGRGDRDTPATGGCSRPGVSTPNRVSSSSRPRYVSIPSWRARTMPVVTSPARWPSRTSSRWRWRVAVPQPSGRSPALIVTSFATRSGWRTASAMPTSPPRLAPRYVTGPAHRCRRATPRSDRRARARTAAAATVSRSRQVEPLPGQHSVSTVVRSRSSSSASAGHHASMPVGDPERKRRRRDAADDHRDRRGPELRADRVAGELDVVERVALDHHRVAAHDEAASDVRRRGRRLALSRTCVRDGGLAPGPMSIARSRTSCLRRPRSRPRSGRRGRSTMPRAIDRPRPEPL